MRLLCNCECTLPIKISGCGILCCIPVLGFDGDMDGGGRGMIDERRGWIRGRLDGLSDGQEKEGWMEEGCTGGERWMGAEIGVAGW